MAGNIKGNTIELQGNVQTVRTGSQKANAAKSTATEMRQWTKL